MKCYNHPTEDAVGLCKNCNKGICRACLTELDNGLACTATCVEEVEHINSLIQKSKTSYTMAFAAHRRNAYVMLSLGIGFIIFGLQIDAVRHFLTTMGIIMIIGAALSFNLATKYRDKEK